MACSWLDNLLALLLPERCIICGRKLVTGERHVCLGCLASLPRTDIHHGGMTPLHERLAATDIVIDRVASWFYYKSGAPETALVTVAKYNGRPSLARQNGRLFAGEIASTGFFDGIDLLQPVPLAPIKRMSRGFNQSRMIAEGVSEVTGIPVADMLKARHHATQTRKSAFLRWLNTGNIFSAGKNAATTLAGKHILIIDDVLTTGSTALACARAIIRVAPSATVSILTIGATRQQ